MAERPSGTVTFLFTDIEGSTRLWEADPEAMQVRLAAHDEVLRSAIEGRGGWLFKHTGDGVCAAFGSAPDAVAAAVDAQRRLGLLVRMGIGSGTAELRGNDYFGPALNRAARVMAAGHGGLILLSASTASLLDDFDMVDLGEHPWRDLSGVHRLFQVRADGLRWEFPPLRTLDIVPGNLPVQTTSFVGRREAVEELVTAMRTRRLITLTGVGGVGKTRLAVQVAGELVPEFPDGVWLIELAPVGDPASLADAVATALGVAPQPGMSVTDSIARALSGRRLMMLLDNCEHVVNAAAELVEAVLSRTKTVKVMATSREGLRVGGEHLWAVPSLSVDGDDSEGVQLFAERAREVMANFSLDDEVDGRAVSMICRRLDGIALAIELAAARMVAMSPAEVADRLSDRFRLLAGGRRGVERHQTLRHVVAWSFDLLNDDEKTVLTRCSVFAGGFDLAAATHLCDRLDEYQVLDGLDSLVRKSLVTAQRAGGHTRYGIYETIRQFAEEQLAATADMTEVRVAHAAYFAAESVKYWEIWDSPGMRVALDWVDVEFANLRAGFRWAADHDRLGTATTIAAHTTLLAHMLQQWEPVGWAEEILRPATTADLTQLPRLYTAASFCVYTGQPEDSVRYAQKALALEADSCYEGFQPGLSAVMEANALVYSGGIDRGIELVAELAIDLRPGYPRALALAFLEWLLPAVGRDEEARTAADETLAAARDCGNPFVIAAALANGYGRAFATTDPDRALRAFREALAVCREHRILCGEAYIAYDAAGLEASHGDLRKALELFDFAIDSWQRAGDHPNLAIALANLAIHFDHAGQPAVAARIYGASAQSYSSAAAPGLGDMVEHSRGALGPTDFDDLVASGAAMELGDAAAYARQQIRLATQEAEPT